MIQVSFLPKPHPALCYLQQSFIQGWGGGGGGGGAWNSPPPPPPPPQNPEIEYGYCCFVTGIKQQSCPRLRQNLRGSKFKNFPGRGGGACPQTPPSRHTHISVRERTFTCYYYPATILFSLSQLKILYETLYSAKKSGK